MERFRHLDGSDSRIEQEYLQISFQHGNPSEVGVNGCSVEDVIEVLINKLLDFQGRTLACEENATALWHLSAAQDALIIRRRRRESEGVLGTISPHQDAPVPVQPYPDHLIPSDIPRTAPSDGVRLEGKG